MKLTRLPEYVLVSTVIFFGIIFAIYCGQMVGGGQAVAVGKWFILACAFALGLKLREKIWLLIPMTWSLLGQLQSLSIPFSLREVVILFVFAIFLTLKAFKIVKRKPTFGILDIIIAINLIYLLTVYVRNPAGMLAFSSERVGGKPYVSVLIASIACWLLSQVIIEPGRARRLIFLMIVGPSIEFVLGFISFHFPSAVPFLSQIYTGITLDTYSSTTSTEAPDETVGSTRLSYMASLGSSLSLALCALFRPLTLINPEYILRFAVYLFSLYAVTLSGFRSSMLAVIAMFVLGSYFWKGKSDLIRMGVFAIPVFSLILLAQGRAFELPAPVQRSLSFLPALWDEDIVEDANSSTQWRVEIWKTVLSSDKYIKNKWLGDGFGFSMRDLELAMAGNMENFSGENQMINGDYHSGPISAIRFVGVVGLVLYYVLLIFLARRAWQLIRRAKGTPFFSLALFIGMPAVFEPINYTFIFGGFQVALPQSIYVAGLLKLLANSLEAYERARAEQPLPASPSTLLNAPVRPFERPIPVGALAYGKRRI